MKSYVHARLGPDDQAVLDELKRGGRSESELVRRGLRLVAEEERRRPSALALAGSAVGRFRHGPRDLSTAKEHLEDFGS